jgi:hypothetical protein
MKYEHGWAKGFERTSVVLPSYVLKILRERKKKSGISISFSIAEIIENSGQFDEDKTAENKDIKVEETQVISATPTRSLI